MTRDRGHVPMGRRFVLNDVITSLQHRIDAKQGGNTKQGGGPEIAGIGKVVMDEQGMPIPASIQARRELLGKQFGRQLRYTMTGGALVLASRDRVDYSVTKGGLRLWACLFVFIVLCSSLYTVISRDMIDIAMDLDDDGELDDDIDDDDALHDHQKRFTRNRDTTPSRGNEEKFKQPPSHRGLVGEDIEGENADNNADDDDDVNVEEVDDNENDEPEVTIPEKVSKSNKRTHESKSHKTLKHQLDYQDELDEAEMLAALKRRAEQRMKTEATKIVSGKGREKDSAKKRHSEIADADEEDDEEDIEEEQDAETPKAKPKIRVFRTKGKLPELRQAVIHKAKLKTKEEEDEDEKEEQNDETQVEDKDEGTDDHSIGGEKKKPISVKTFRRKGTAPLKPKRDTVSQPREIDAETCRMGKCSSLEIEEDEEQVEVEENEETATHSPPKKVKVIRRKGVDPKKRSASSAPMLQSNLHADVDDIDDDVVDEDILPVELSDLPIQKSLTDSSRRSASVPKYKKHAITNRDDNKIRDRLDKADQLLDQQEYEKSLAAFDALLKQYPESPRVHYGRARALDLHSEKRQSNQYLDKALQEYQLVVDSVNSPEGLILECGQLLVARYRFRGWLHKAIKVQRMLSDRFPDHTKLKNELGVTFLMMNRIQDAKKVFQDILKLDASDPVAQVHYGFILKTVDNDLDRAVDYMAAGMASGLPGTQDARFFFHLGDALQRLNREEEAYRLYDKGVEDGMFLSRYQRSLYNVKGLSSRPWWTPEQTGHVAQLRRIERDWRVIKEEALRLLTNDGQSFKYESEKLTNKGMWKQFTLYEKGKMNEENCRKAPKTCEIVSQFEDAVNCTRGQIKFSLLEGNTHVWPHCGPTNCRLRSHLGLLVPTEPRIKVAQETKSWKQGKFIVLDDSFEHSVWHEGKSPRLILIIDFWHPEISAQLKKTLSPI